MLLWVVFFAGLALLTAAGALAFAIYRSERRARRALYRSLGLEDRIVEQAMQRNGAVWAELAMLRQEEQDPSAGKLSPTPPPN
jgi:hypothetical protein